VSSPLTLPLLSVSKELLLYEKQSEKFLEGYLVGGMLEEVVMERFCEGGFYWGFDWGIWGCWEDWEDWGCFFRDCLDFSFYEKLLLEDSY